MKLKEILKKLREDLKESQLDLILMLIVASILCIVYLMFAEIGLRFI